MKPISGYQLVRPEDLVWRQSNLMKIPNADYLERTGSQILGARLWRLPAHSANTLHKHVRSEEFFFVLEGTGRMRVGEATVTVPRYGGILVGPDALRQVFNDTDSEVLWFIVGAPEELELLPGSKSKMDLSLFYPTDPTQLPKELAGKIWPPDQAAVKTASKPREPVNFEQRIDAWLAAWNSHDLELIVSHYSEDVEFCSSLAIELTESVDGTLRGKDVLRRYFARGLAAFPSLNFELIELYQGVGSCVVQYHSVNGKRAAEWMEFDASGRICRARAHYA